MTGKQPDTSSNLFAATLQGLACFLNNKKRTALCLLPVMVVIILVNNFLIPGSYGENITTIAFIVCLLMLLYSLFNVEA